ncbi:mediator of RNA polymerase II transcription subunit 9 [Chiloscyllium plagiosum]|uniref:mediator of RNA polymerase II transcription subunit 9 n=1 Tax=Chiloscyllium plagiosum TaxID=36176 RepID=UPI001CB88297|nr:mediator of RNA polymerase II transcription subunit 9 [Chiloscyllium plagiosum]
MTQGEGMAAGSGSGSGTVSVTKKILIKQEDCSFLPIVHDIIKCMDKDSQDVHQELNKLKTKLQETREMILAMPGIDLSPEQQQLQLQNLRDQVRTKNELLQKYKSLCMFDIPKT